MDEDEIEGVLRNWVNQLPGEETATISIDGKYLRGSHRRRPKETAVEVIGAATQELKLVVGQQVVEDNQELEAAVELLQAIPKPRSD